MSASLIFSTRHHRVQGAGRLTRHSQTTPGENLLYLGDSPAAAVAETLRRDLRLDGTERVVPQVLLRGKILTELEVHAEPTAAAHPDLAEIPGTAIPLDTTAGRRLVARILDDHSAVLSTRN